MSGDTIYEYRIRLDSSTRIRVLETQLSEARLELIRKDPSYETLIRFATLMYRDSARIMRYMFFKEELTDLNLYIKVRCIERVNEVFMTAALNIINERRLKP